MPDKVNLHDAKLESIQIDAAERLLRVCINRYVSHDSSASVQSTVEFKNVQSFSGVLDLLTLASNAWAGNVEDWEPSTGFGLSHLYFVRGVLSIYADEPVILDSVPQSIVTAKGIAEK